MYKKYSLKEKIKCLQLDILQQISYRAHYHKVIRWKLIKKLLKRFCNRYCMTHNVE